MPDVPDDMKRKDRQEDPNFSPDELLYRRVPHEAWDDHEIELDAIKLPDMSVNRQKYGPPEWLRLIGDDAAGWGVIGFCVKDVPPKLQHIGVYDYIFRVLHVPLAKNYPHSEVRAYERPAGCEQPETHIGKELVGRITPDVHLRWREQLRRKCRIILKANEAAPHSSST